jgi:thioredoxin reductase (NADPH)
MNPPTTEEFMAARRPQMFPALNDDQIRRVAACGTVTTFEPGELVFEQGDEDLPFYVVLDGEMEIVHPSGDTEELITVHHAKEFTGEISLVTDGPTFVRGRARGPLRTIRVTHERFKNLIQVDSDLSEVLMRAFILRRMGLISAGQGDVVVIGSRDSAATERLQAFLVQTNHPYRYIDVNNDPDVEAILCRFKVAVDEVPVVICRGSQVLRNPSESELADCLGFNPRLEPRSVHDVVICGAGPGGLAAAVYSASEGLDVLVIDGAAPGGQAASSSKIENYLGFPTGVSGGALMGRALVQAEKFGARVVVAHPVLRFGCNGHSIQLEMEGGRELVTRALVLAMGVQYRKLDLPDRARFEGVGIYYAATFVEAQRCGNDEVIVVGGGNSAGQAATFLSRQAKHVHMLIRGPDLAASMSRYLIRRIEETPNITLHKRTRIVGLAGKEHLEEVTWRDDASGETLTLPIRHVFTMAGAVPNTDWLRGLVQLDQKGFVCTGADLTAELLRAAHWPLARAPLLFETSVPRVFAVGDLRANSVKRVASAVGEGSVCVQLVHRVLNE